MSRARSSRGSWVSADARYTVVCERQDDGRNKLCRLMLSDDGSYFVTVPYHRSDKVFLTKRRVNHANPMAALRVEPLEVALLEDDDDRLKLSHHPSGFVQSQATGSGPDATGGNNQVCAVYRTGGVTASDPAIDASRVTSCARAWLEVLLAHPLLDLRERVRLGH